MSSATLDRFGRIVIPSALRQRHGWKPGVELELRDGPDGISLVAVRSAAPAPAGWAWQDGMLVCTATATVDITDLAAFRDGLDAQRDAELGNPS